MNYHPRVGRYNSTWSIACMEKLNVMNSQIGFRPACKIWHSKSHKFYCNMDVFFLNQSPTIIYHNDKFYFKVSNINFNALEFLMMKCYQSIKS